VEFLAIKPAHRDRWQLPKGRIDPGETPAQAALREVREEGGVDADIVADLGPINFEYNMNHTQYAKRVDFFLMAYRSGDPQDHDHEVQEARWFPLREHFKLAFATERTLVERAAAMSAGRS
jgi:mutator protein MutT